MQINDKKIISSFHGLVTSIHGNALVTCFKEIN